MYLVRVSIFATFSSRIDAVHLEPTTIFEPEHERIAVHFERRVCEPVALIAYERAGNRTCGVPATL